MLKDRRDVSLGQGLGSGEKKKVGDEREDDRSYDRDEKKHAVVEKKKGKCQGKGDWCR